MRANPRARWPWLFCAAVLLFAGHGVAKGRRSASEDASARACETALGASACWAQEPACERTGGNWRPCRVQIRTCIARALRCSGGVWR